MLRVINLSIGHHAPLAQGIHFSLESGKITSIIGASGIGKSTLLRTIAGLRPALSGEIYLHQTRISRPHPNIAFIFQQPALLPWLTVADNILFGSQFKRQPTLSKAEQTLRLQTCLAELELSSYAQTLPHTLSGGMAQRVALARALVRRPEILLLDEPFSALDLITRQSMHTLLKELVRKYQTAALLITHDLDEALSLSDEVLLISRLDEHSVASLTHHWQLSQHSDTALIKAQIFAALQTKLAA